MVPQLCVAENRVIGETNMNERSSRSHTIVTMAIESRERDEEEEGGGKDGPVKVSSIVSCKVVRLYLVLHSCSIFELINFLCVQNLVDLAGSERVSTNSAEWNDVRFKEGTFINLSLLTLGNVIAKLSEGSRYYFSATGLGLTPQPSFIPQCTHSIP